MSRATSPVTGKPYGLAIVCRVWRLARSGVYRHLTPAPAASPRRRGPTGAMTDAALTVAIRAVLAASPFHGEGHRKVWARLRHAGTRTSLRRVLRLMHENDLLAPSRLGSAHGPRAHDGTIIPETVDMMWGTDLTATFTGEGHAAVFIAVDHCSAECVGIHAHPRATRFEALEPIRQGGPARLLHAECAAADNTDMCGCSLLKWSAPIGAGTAQCGLSGVVYCEQRRGTKGAYGRRSSSRATSWKEGI